MKKKLAILVLVMSLVIVLAAIPSLAADQVHVRILGPEGDIFSGYVPFTEGMTVADAFDLADVEYSTSEGTTGTTYTIEGFANALYGTTSWSYDGGSMDLDCGQWIFGGTVANATAGMFGPDTSLATILTAGDDLLLYYFYMDFGTNESASFVNIDTSKFNEGKILFTTTGYDESYNTVTVGYEGLTVKWYTNGKANTYTTDAEGAITLAAADKAVGDHIVEYGLYSTTKKNDAYPPIVYPSASDCGVTITAAGASVAYGLAQSGPVATGDNAVVIMAIVAVLALTTAVVTKKVLVK